MTPEGFFKRETVRQATPTPTRLEPHGRDYSSAHCLAAQAFDLSAQFERYHQHQDLHSRHLPATSPLAKLVLERPPLSRYL